MLAVDRWPTLRDPALVIALTGWVDAGLAGSGAATALRDQMPNARTFATLDLTDLMDLQQTRPVARFAAPNERVIDWPQLTFTAGKLGRDVVVISGPEPSLRWPSVSRSIVDTARQLDVKVAYSLAGMPALASHRRPVQVHASATHRSFAQELAPLRAAYAGPTGLQTIVQRALGDADIPSAGLWAQVPQYVSGSPSPPAVRALVQRLAELARLDVDLHALDARCDAYVAKVDEHLAERPDVAEVVERIDREQASGSDDLVSEIEQFLRSQHDE